MTRTAGTADDSLGGDVQPGDEVPLAPGTRLDRYVIRGVVGVGGMSIVYAATDPELARDVAIKVLKPSPGSGASRLVHEGHALARLSHPNVVPVHDVGTVGARVFLVEELVDGVNLAVWLAAAPRLSREILGVMIEAGRGLAAAHAAGFVHRDFKPENVLVGRDGRVRVVDFGLVSPPASSDGEIGDGAGDVTATGPAPGTPAYMAPEQHRGEPITALADQFGFCVTLYEALHGARPFAGATRVELADAICAGRIRAVDRRPPAWLDRLIRRGLAVSPEARHRDMGAILAELSRDRGRIWRRVAVVAILGLGLAVGFGRGLLGGDAATCDGADSQIDSTWGAERRAAVERAFAGSPFAAVAGTRTVAALDRWRAAFVEAHGEACRATRVRGEQSEEMLDRRMACLAGARAEVDAFVAELEQANPGALERAVVRSELLPELAPCADPALLALPVIPPPAGSEAAVERAREGLVRARARRLAGRSDEGRPWAVAALALAVRLDFAPLAAEAHHELGAIAFDQQQGRRGLDELYEAAAQADVARDDLRAAEIWVDLVSGLALAARFEEAHRALRLAEAAIQRVHASPRVQALLESHAAILALQEGKADEAIARLGRERALLEQAAPGTVRLATVGEHLGLAQLRRGDLAAAERELVAARDEFVRILGPEHPEVGVAWQYLASVYLQAARSEEAVAAYRTALARLEPHRPAGDSLVTQVHGNLAMALGQLGRHQEALEHFERVFRARGDDGTPEIARVLGGWATSLAATGRLDEAEARARRGVAILADRLGDGHADTATALSNLANLLYDRGKLDEALVEHRRALAALEKAVGPEHLLTGYAQLNLGYDLLALRRAAEARPAFERALAIWERSLGADNPQCAEALTGLGRTLVELGQARAAIAPLERALALREANQVDPADLLATREALVHARRLAGARHVGD